MLKSNWTFICQAEIWYAMMHMDAVYHRLCISLRRACEFMVRCWKCTWASYKTLTDCTHFFKNVISVLSCVYQQTLQYSHFPTTGCPIPPFFSFPDVCIIIHNLKQWSCRYDSTTWSVQQTFAWKRLRRGVGWGGGIRLPPALKSLSCSKSWVTHWAGSCLAFSNANDGQHWKPQIGPFRSSVWCLVRPCSCWRPWSFSCPPPSLLCAAVIGTDVLLASHRATFP